MIFAIRHAERADRVPNPPDIKIPFDPPITETGLPYLYLRHPSSSTHRQENSRHFGGTSRSGGGHHLLVTLSPLSHDCRAYQERDCSRFP